MKVSLFSCLAVVAPVCFGQGVITTAAGTDFIFPDEGKPAIEGRLVGPRAMALDSRGAIYFADGHLNQVMRIEADGTIRVVAGNGSLGFSGDGGLAIKATMISPFGLAVDRDSNLFIGDSYDNRIRRVDAKSGVITTVAGNGSPKRKDIRSVPRL